MAIKASGMHTLAKIPRELYFFFLKSIDSVSCYIRDSWDGSKFNWSFDSPAVKLSSKSALTCFSFIAFNVCSSKDSLYHLRVEQIRLNSSPVIQVSLGSVSGFGVIQLQTSSFQEDIEILVNFLLLSNTSLKYFNPIGSFSYNMTIFNLRITASAQPRFWISISVKHLFFSVCSFWSSTWMEDVDWTKNPYYKSSRICLRFKAKTYICSSKQNLYFVRASSRYLT